MEYAAYTVRGDTVILYRMYGTGPVVFVPDQIDGRRVEILADHLFAREMSVLCDRSQLLLAENRGSSWTALQREECAAKSDLLRRLEEEALCGDRVSSVHIPEGVRQIGNYAFYGLYRLREVSFPSSMNRIGWGMFNGCRVTDRIILHLSPPGKGQTLSRPEEGITPCLMKEVVDALPNELDVIVKQGDGELYRLRFPAYYEEGKENTPARIIEIIYHGTGHQYRNCFLNRKLQLDLYDEVFPLAAAQESPLTNVQLILNRLRSGYCVKEDIMQRYLEYLRREDRTMMEVILEDEEFDPVLTFRMLDEKGFFTAMVLDASIQTASQRKVPAAVSCLMEIRSRRFGGKTGGRMRTRYEL